MIVPLSQCATQQDFIDLYGQEEAIEITNLCDSLATTINTTKLQLGLDLAQDIVNAKFLIASDCGRALIKTSCRMLVLWISRYVMDSTKSRPMVDEDYKRAMEMLEYACTECVDRCPLSKEEVNSILGQNVSRSTKLRCYSGEGNRFKRGRRRIKVDRFHEKFDGFFYEHYYSHDHYN